MQKLKLALDWTPNINHIGFFVAGEKGFYQDNGVEVLFTDPGQDNYALTPAKKVELGQVDFALCPTESIISYRTKAQPFPLIAIAAILQEDLSAIAVLEGNGVKTPKDLDGCSYASYQARYEDEIVRCMIRNAGGQGNIKVAYPAKLGIWETVLKKEYDATWVFMNWEAVQIEGKGAALKYFKMADYDVPYSYSPVIAANQALLAPKQAAYRAFLKASKEGYLYAQQNPEEAAQILAAFVPEHDQNIDLVKALAVSTDSFGSKDNWGQMELSEVQQFLNWLQAQGLENQALAISDLVTNQLLP